MSMAWNGSQVSRFDDSLLEDTWTRTPSARDPSRVQFRGGIVIPVNLNVSVLTT